MGGEGEADYLANPISCFPSSGLQFSLMAIFGMGILASSAFRRQTAHIGVTKFSEIGGVIAKSTGP